MAKKIILLISVLCVFSTTVFAQPDWFHPTEEQKKIFMQLRDLELLKTLDLSEEESVRVLPLVKNIDNVMHDFFKQNRQIMEDLQNALDKNDQKKVSKMLDELITTEAEYRDKKAALHEKLREELDEEKYARYLIFMQSFGRELQDKIKMMREGDDFPDRPMKNPDRG